MSKGVNKVILVGRLGNDPEFTQTTSGMQVAKCSLATSRIWNDDQGQKQEKTEWHRVVFFNRLAEIVSQYLKKGMQIYVEGELRTNSWEKDGITRYSTEIIAREMQMLGGRSGGQDGPGADQYDQEFGGGSGGAANSQAKQQSSPPAGGAGSAGGAAQQTKDNPQDDIDQDIPF